MLLKEMIHQVGRIPHISRNELFATVFMIAVANGLSGKIISSARLRGFFESALDTFGISAIVVASCFFGLALILRSEDSQQATTADLSVCALFLLLAALPPAALAWLSVSAVSLYLLLFCRVKDSARRGAVILLATTVPMLWSRMLFDLFAKPILQVDASMIGWLLGTRRTGNVVEFADKSGMLVIFEGCSSLANMSLAVLCWITLSQVYSHKSGPRDLFWLMCACGCVVAVNVLRISLMGLSQSYYTAIHDTFLGNLVPNIATLGLTVGISFWGIRRDALYGD